jgi:hypothetical protein
MPITIACPCGRQLRVGDEAAGRQGRCPVCGRILDIPLPDRPAALPAPPDAPGVDAPQPEDPILEGTPPPPAPAELPPWPEPAADVAVPEYKLYSAAQVTLAAFLGSVLAGGVLLALNYRALGDRRAAVWSVLLGLLALAALLGIGFTLPDPASTVVCLLLNIVGLVVIYQITRGLQGARYEAHLDRGGRGGSTGAAVGIALLCGALAFACLFGLAFAYEALFGLDTNQRVTFGIDEEVYYTGGATEAEARAVGRALQRNGFFDGRGGKTVQVSRGGGGFVVSFVVLRNTWDDPQAVAEFRAIAGQLSREAFGGRPVEVRLCDEYLSTRKTIR